MKTIEKITELENRIAAIESKINSPSFAASVMGGKTSPQKKQASRENGKKGGRPRKK
jgi:hypothetical protein